MLVSVVIPAFNTIYVRDAILSIVNQTHTDVEVIVVDDESPGTGIRDICEEFEQVRYIRQKNAGPSAARNNGIRHAKGEWIAFLDDDDEWLPEKLEKQVAFIRNHPDPGKIGLIYTGQYMFHDKATLGTKIDEANGMIFPLLLFGNFIGTCSSIMIPKRVFDDVGDYDAGLICSQDFELYLRIARKYEIHSISEPLIRYRTRPDQISKNPTLNNSDDEEILNRQKEHVDGATFEKAKRFHRKVASLRFKRTAYDSLFELKDRAAYWKWMTRSCVEGRNAPSLPSLAYFGLTLAPDSLIEKVAARRRSRSAEGTGPVAHYQKVAEEFSWMGVSRGSI